MFHLKFLVLWLLVTITAHGQFNPWEARHRLSSDQYQAAFNDLVGKGYHLNYVSGYTINNIPQYAGVWEKKPSPEWVARHGMTSSDYQTAFDTYIQQGFRLVLVNGYEVSGQDYYVAIWDKSPPPAAWVARHGMTSADYQTTFNDLVGKGYRLTHVSAYTVQNIPRFAAIWELRNDGIQWVARHGMTSAEYQTQFNTYLAQGYRLVDVSGYQVSNVEYYAAIWDKSGGLFRARHGLTSPQYQSEFNNDIYQGYVLKVVSGFAVGGSDQYAAIWDNNVMSSTDLSFIDNKITTYMTNNTVPGLTIAIAKNDRLVFAKGYGLADNGPAQTPVDPTSMFRIASVSKAFTATTIMWLTEHYASYFPKGIDSPVFGTGALLGTTYGTNKNYPQRVKDITVRHLLEHTAGWNPSDPQIDVTGQPLATRTKGEMITHVLDSVPQIRDPGVFSSYLNF